MTLATWKKEFYPVAPTKRMTKIQAIEHSILKWSGLSKTILEKHELVCGWGEIREKDTNKSFEIDVTSCALCKKYRKEISFEDLEDIPVDEHDAHICGTCPLYETLGMACDAPPEQGIAPYQSFVGNLKDSRPMLKVLKLTLKRVQKQEKANG